MPKTGTNRDFFPARDGETRGKFRYGRAVRTARGANVFPAVSLMRHPERVPAQER